MSSIEFKGAAHAQCTALGMPQYEPVWVPHPVQPKLPDEVRALADNVVEQIVTKLLDHRIQRAA